MLIEATPAPAADGLADAKARVQIGPAPAWAASCPFDAQFKALQPEHLTYLCFNRQVHAENRQTYVHVAVRLETMQAVQRESQWRLQFEPRTQWVTLHSICIRRGEQTFEHARLEEVRLLQREEGLEGYVIDGWFTLLLVLSDVRPGDILEWRYTIRHEPRLLPQCCSSFFSLPQDLAVAKYAFSVRFDPSRPMKWKSSSEDLAPAESREDGQVRWLWAGEQAGGLKPETNIPPWHLPGPWIQVSDCADWDTVAAAFGETWKEEGEDPTLAELVRELEEKGEDEVSRVEGALQLVQDHCRYLSVNLELGGHVPTAPGLVARRRFGDCKDLSFLLVHLLRRLGVAARPVLVNSALRKAVADMLPMPGLFNHVVVEFTLQGETQWVDATLRRQGGGPLGRFIPDYGVGLPLGQEASGLVAFPRPPENRGTYELRETLLLDTTGAPSRLAAVLTATGFHAELLRQQLDQRGAQEMARERLQAYKNRFFNATREGEPEFRDDRAGNEILLAEVFEVNGFLSPTETPQLCSVPLANNLVATTLPLPDQRPDAPMRRSPLALPYPCNVVHSIEVQSPGLRPFSNPRSGVESRFLTFGRLHKSGSGSWSATLKLTTHTDAVLPEEIHKYGNVLEQVLQESMLSLFVPAGHPRPRPKSSFGRLPAPLRKPSEAKATPGPRASATFQAEDSKGIGGTTAAESGTPSALTRPALPSHRRRRHSRHKRRKRNQLIWGIILAVVALGLAILWIVVYRAEAQRGHGSPPTLFQKPAP